MRKLSSRLFLALVLPGLLGAAEQRHRVDSPAALREALRRAGPGDHIQLRDEWKASDARRNPFSAGSAGLIQLVGSPQGDLTAPFGLRQPLPIPFGYASGFLDRNRLAISPRCSAAN